MTEGLIDTTQPNAFIPNKRKEKFKQKLSPTIRTPVNPDMTKYFYAHDRARKLHSLITP